MDPTNALNAQASQAFGADAYPPMEPASPPPPVTATTHSLVATAGEQCPSCGVHVAADQRYCLSCGARCGEPRLPIMDAVTFMDAMKQPREASAPQPPQSPPRRLSANTALFATIGVLLLAMGVGVLIGRSGNRSVASTPVAPQVIKVGGGEEGASASSEGASGGGKIGGNSKKEKPKALKAEADSGKGAEEILHYAPGVKPPDPKVELGDKCEEGTAGCTHGKFEGEFFEE
jgi:hypothetical protein